MEPTGGRFLNLVQPLQGSKIIIEGTKQKAGKTLLGVSMCLAFANLNPKIVIYGNIDVDHPNYTKKSKITRKDFDKDKQYLLFYDEVDLDFPYQDHHYNEGFWAFWGRGSSHNKCAVIITIQNEYAQMRNTLQRTCHILVHRTLVNSNTTLPFMVLGELLYSEYGSRGEFDQNIENAVGRYDPYDNQDNKINFNFWRARRLRDVDESSTGSTPKTSTLHKGQRDAVKKLMTETIARHGNISKAAQATKVSRNFFHNIMGEDV